MIKAPLRVEYLGGEGGGNTPGVAQTARRENDAEARRGSREQGIVANK